MMALQQAMQHRQIKRAEQLRRLTSSKSAPNRPEEFQVSDEISVRATNGTPGYICQSCAWLSTPKSVAAIQQAGMRSALK